MFDNDILLLLTKVRATQQTDKRGKEEMKIGTLTQKEKQTVKMTLHRLRTKSECYLNLSKGTEDI